MNILHVKSIKNLLMPCVSVVVSGDFCRFKLALLSLLSMSKDEKEANLGIQVENTRFQRNAREVLVFRHVPRCSEHRS